MSEHLGRSETSVAAELACRLTQLKTLRAAGGLREHVERATHGRPPDRACLPGHDKKWEGYLLGVEEAIHAAEEWLRESDV